jgi:hypothetical protein
MASVSDPFDVIQHQTYRIDAMDFMNFGCGYAALREPKYNIMVYCTAVQNKSHVI